MPLFGPEARKQLREVGRVSTIGIEIALSIVFGMLAGRWLDNKLDTSPYLTIFGLILGVVAGFRSLYQLVRRERERLKNRDE